MIHPGPAHEKSMLLDAAYDEYCRHQDSAQGVDVEQFLSRYSAIRSSLRRQIEVHDFLADRSQLVDLCQDAQLPEAQWPEIGDKVFDFTILEELGRGAFARVYLCRQSGVGERQVVVKFAAEGAYEADTLGRLSHPNIMPVHSVQLDELDNRSAICMPFRGRSTLCDLVDRSFSGAALPSQGEDILRVARQDIGPDDQFDDVGLPDPYLERCSYVNGVVHLGIQLADAISHAHQRGIRHNDLKPSNVLLTATGRPMLLDFNLANSAAAGAQTPGGTMPYMSPEQLAEFRYQEGIEPAELDERSDVFSLGVILFELLSGRLPFGEIVAARAPSERAKALAAAQARGPQSLRALNAQVDPYLAGLIERCLLVDKTRRPPSATALSDALRRQVSLLHRGRRWTSRHQAFAIGTLLAAMLLMGAAAGFFATRDSYTVRQQNLAVADLNGGRFDAAITRLNPVLAAAPQDADALYLRGLAHMRAKHYQQAIADLEASRRVRPDVRIQAAQAYCLCRLKYYREARFLYTKAIEAGYGHVDAKNNLAFCYLKERKFPKALELLNNSDRIDLLTAQNYLNRVAIHLFEVGKNDQSQWDRAIADVSRLLELHAPNSHVELMAARIFSLAGSQDPRMSELSLEHLKKAYSRGIGLTIEANSLINDPDFATIRTSSEFLNTVQQKTNRDRESDPLPDPLIEPDIHALLTAMH